MLCWPQILFIVYNTAIIVPARGERGMVVVICVNQPLSVDKLLLCAYVSGYFNCITFVVCMCRVL
jgi:hypothetical protein